MKKLLNLLVLMAVLILLSGCATTQNVQPCTFGGTYGFFMGLWHGFVAPLAFLGHLFNSSIAIYAVNNNGGWYDFGFLLGIGGFSGGIFASSKKSKD
ncbi:MAG TPA: hypothetical protein VIH31_00175 [Candidatus Paceibacterota bacterium]